MLESLRSYRFFLLPKGQQEHHESAERTLAHDQAEGATKRGSNAPLSFTADHYNQKISDLVNRNTIRVPLNITE